MAAPSVFVCESQPLVLEGLERVFERTGEFRLVGWAPDPAAALRRISDLKPQMALVGYNHGGSGPGWRSVLQLLGELRQVCPDTRAVLSVNDDVVEAECYRALQMGAHGVFKKSLSVDDLMECLHAVSAGRVWLKGFGDSAESETRGRLAKPRLTPREREVVRLVARGLKNREVADRLAITAGTVKVHLMHVFEKTGVKDRYQLSMRARDLLGGEAENAGAAD